MLLLFHINLLCYFVHKFPRKLKLCLNISLYVVFETYKSSVFKSARRLGSKRRSLISGTQNIA